MNPRVVKVRATDDYRLHLVFSNSEKGVYDCSPLLDWGVFQELREKNYFTKAKAIDGTVVWPNDQDICPDTLYRDSVKEP